MIRMTIICIILFIIESDQPLPNSMYGRYYHLFVMGELDDLISKVPALKIDKSFYEQGNWVVHVTKVV